MKTGCAWAIVMVFIIGSLLAMGIANIEFTVGLIGVLALVALVAWAGITLIMRYVE